MIGILSLWLPIVLSAVLVFVASSIIHMLLPYHRSDYGKVTDEDGFMTALRPFGLSPGDYVVPNAGGDMELMKSEAFRAKVQQGPVMFFTVMDPGRWFSMGRQLALWFVYCLVVSVFAAYLASRTLAPGAEYLEVFRVSGTVAFACYGVGVWQRSIWFAQKWSTTLKSTFDSLIYALLTAGSFGGFWPS